VAVHVRPGKRRRDSRGAATAWSAAAIAGPVIITELSARDRAGLARGASKIHIYDRLLQILARLLAAGFLAILVRSVRPNQEA
jgi:hypothetical protein